ncbi:MAG: hypothetical protein AAGJ81_15705, partial [Verrucomicrobiota bacterium]
TSGSPSNTEIKQSSDSRSLILRNRRATDPYGRWCGGGGVIPPRYPIRVGVGKSHAKIQDAKLRGKCKIQFSHGATELTEMGSLRALVPL